MRTTSLVITVVLLCTGCAGLTGVAALVAGLSETQAGRAACSGTACNFDRWLLVLLRPDGLTWEGGSVACPASYRFAFASSDNDARDVSINIAKDMLVAAVTGDGVVHVAPFGQADALVDGDFDAAAVAWSNGGDRLAVLTKDSGAGQRVVLVDEALAVLGAFDVSGGRLSNMSWSGDDRHLAITSDQRDPRLRVIALDEGTLDELDGFTGYYIGDDLLVGWDAASGQFESFKLLDGQVQDAEPLTPQPRRVIGSASLAGVFLTEENSRVGPPLRPPVVSLRTLSAGPNPVSTFGQGRLVPIDTARPVLEAAGFSVDGPCADPGGSGGG